MVLATVCPATSSTMRLSFVMTLRSRISNRGDGVGSTDCSPSAGSTSTKSSSCSSGSRPPSPVGLESVLEPAGAVSFQTTTSFLHTGRTIARMAPPGRRMREGCPHFTARCQRKGWCRCIHVRGTLSKLRISWWGQGMAYVSCAPTSNVTLRHLILFYGNDCDVRWTLPTLPAS